VATPHRSGQRDVVGFVMWGVDPEDESFWIGGLIIDRRHQRRGYGRALVAQLLERAASDGHREAALSYDPQKRWLRSLSTRAWDSSRPASSRISRPWPAGS
jgi:GNAT superfamily N-acetyltransferase